MLVFAGWLCTNRAKALGWVAYNMNKRHARGNSLKDDKKQAWRIRVRQWPAEALGKIWLLGDYDDSNWTEAARSFVTGGGWEVEKKDFAGKNDERATPSPIFFHESNHKVITRNGRVLEDENKVVQKSTFERLWTWGCKQGSPSSFDLIDGRFSSLQAGQKVMSKPDWVAQRRKRKKHQWDLFGFRLSVTKRNVAATGIEICEHRNPTKKTLQE